MISITFLTVFVSCLAYAFGDPQKQAQTEASTENPSRLLTEVGYIRYGDPFYIYPTPEERQYLFPQAKNPTETNELESQEPNRRPLFVFTTNESPLSSSQKQQLSQSGPFIEIRKKRDVSSDAAVPETSLIGKLRKKRSHCKKCGGGGYGGYGGGYIPVSYAVYPVYTSYVPSYQPTYQVPSYGGGCNTCGGGGHGGGGGSFSYSSSSSKSSSGSWGYGK